MEKEQSGMQSMKRAFAILEAFTESENQMGITEVGRATGLHKSTVYRFLNALELEGYVIKDSETGKYNLGFKTLKLSRHLLANLAVRQKGRLHLEALAKRVNELVKLSVFEQGETVCVDCVEGKKNCPQCLEIGVRSYAHCTSAGKILLSEVSPKMLRLILAKKGLPALTARTITDYSTLNDELKQVRKQGFAYGNAECTDNGACVAAAVRNEHGNIIAAVSIVGQVEQITPQRVKNELAAAVSETAGLISQEMGFRPLGS